MQDDLIRVMEAADNAAREYSPPDPLGGPADLEEVLRAAYRDGWVDHALNERHRADAEQTGGHSNGDSSKVPLT